MVTRSDYVKSNEMLSRAMKLSSILLKNISLVERALSEVADRQCEIADSSGGVSCTSGCSGTCIYKKSKRLLKEIKES